MKTRLSLRRFGISVELRLDRVDNDSLANPSSPDHAANSLSSPNINPPMAWLFIEYRVYTSYTHTVFITDALFDPYDCVELKDEDLQN